MPIVGDDRVEIGFGTGALKVTPGHDPLDFEIALDHGLDTLLFMDEHGRLRDLKPEWEGLSLDEGHDAALAQLRAEGRIVAEDPLHHSVGFCQRSGARVEPIVSLQWFCKMDDLAATAIDAVRSGRITFHPKRLEKIFFDWMEAIRPWCISRQLWWGHRLPVWFAPDGSYVGAGRAARAATGWSSRPTCSTRGSRRRCGRSRRSAGPTTRRRCGAGTPATCSSPRATSSTSGWRG